MGTLELLQAPGLVHYLSMIEIYKHDLSGMQVGNLELLQAPGLPFNLPRQYASLPRLTGVCAVGVGLFWMGGMKECGWQKGVGWGREIAASIGADCFWSAAGRGQMSLPQRLQSCLAHHPRALVASASPFRSGSASREEQKQGKQARKTSGAWGPCRAAPAGRAEVELVLKEQGGQIAKLRIVLDGYSGGHQLGIGIAQTCSVSRPVGGLPERGGLGRRCYLGLLMAAPAHRPDGRAV